MAEKELIQTSLEDKSFGLWWRGILNKESLWHHNLGFIEKQKSERAESSALILISSTPFFHFKFDVDGDGSVQLRGMMVEESLASAELGGEKISSQYSSPSRNPFSWDQLLVGSEKVKMIFEDHFIRLSTRLQTGATGH